MSKIRINGIEYHRCIDCGCWANGLCRCQEESKSKEVVRLLGMFRERYNHWVFTTPYHGKTRCEE